MTTTSIYTASEVLDKISKIAAKNFDCAYEAIGMVIPGKERVIGKNDRDHKTVMCFYVFDKSLERVGTVYRHEVRKYANGKSESDKEK